jgi:membrane protease YdiL (CAAX protease family)
VAIDKECARIDLKKEAIFGIVYFSFYLGYLFINPESDWLHWVSLVGLPLVLLSIYHVEVKKVSIQATIKSVGLQIEKFKTGLLWSIGLGLGISVLQLFLSQRSDDFLALVHSGRIWIVLPMAFFLLLVTAGFTEEFFFRGVLQTRLEGLFEKKVWAIVVAAVLFGLYHFPYAYLDSHWPSHGNLAKALLTALSEGIPAGLILGFVYTRSKNNLLACILVHTLIDLLPAVTMLRF